MTDDLILEPQRLTSPTVKVRRLGYLVNIPSIVRDRGISPNLLNALVLGWANENKRSFNHYSLQLPVIRSKKTRLTGQITTLGAASRYISTCKEFGFIAQTYAKVKGYRVSKTGRAISTLSAEGNPFKLSLGQTFLVLKSLLEKDYDTMSLLLEILHKREDNQIENFQSCMQDRFKLKIEKAMELNKLYLVDTLKRQIERIQNWRKALRYYPENIEAPRLEWMLDLNFIEAWNQRIDKIHFKNNIDLFFENTLISRKWLEDEFPSLFAQFYYPLFGSRVVYWTELDSDERLNLLNQLLSDSMNIFQTAVNVGKISADEFLEYAMGFLIQNKSTVASLSILEDDLINFARDGKTNYRYVQTVSPADRGYIARL